MSLYARAFAIKKKKLCTKKKTPQHTQKPYRSVSLSPAKLTDETSVYKRAEI